MTAVNSPVYHFKHLPDTARLSVVAASRALSSKEVDRVETDLRSFIREWRSHGRKVTAEVVVLHERFILLAAYVDGGDLSGCGIDASVHVLEELASELNFDWAPALDVFYRDRGEIKQTDRLTFSKLAAQGVVDASTMVFDTAITSLNQLRRTGLELPGVEAWHGRVFRLREPAH